MGKFRTHKESQMPRHIPVVDQLPEGEGATAVVFEGRIAVRDAAGVWASGSDKGDPGTGGTPGERGPEGPEGPEGPQGERGPEGPEGPEGPRGADGTSFNLKGTLASEVDLPTEAGAGDAYFIGSDLWVMGDAWVNAGPVATGPEGPRGPQGLRGADGPRGERGPQGNEGPPGAGGGVRHRGGYESISSYSVGDIVRDGIGTHLATRDIVGSGSANSIGGGSVTRVPGLIVGSYPDPLPAIFPMNGTIRRAVDPKTAYLSYSSPSAVSVNPEHVLLRAHYSASGAEWSFDGLLVEFDIPQAPGAHPVGARIMLANDSSTFYESRLSVQQMTSRIGASPSHGSVGIPRVPFAMPAPGAPLVGELVGTQGGGSPRWYYSINSSYTDFSSMWLGRERGFTPLDLSGDKITLLLTVDGKNGATNVSARIRTQTIPAVPGVSPAIGAPQLLVHYAPDWELLHQRTVARVATKLSGATGFVAIDPADPEVSITPSGGSITIPPGATLFFSFNSPLPLSPDSSVKLTTPWGAVEQWFRARMVESISLTGLTWANSPERAREIGDSALAYPAVPGPMATGMVAARNNGDLPRTVPTSSAGYVLEVV